MMNRLLSGYQQGLVRLAHPSIYMAWKKALSSMKDELTMTTTELKLKHAMADELGGIPNSDLQEIAELTHLPAEYATVMKVILANLMAPKAQYKRILRTLLVLEAVVKFGSSKAAQQVHEEENRVSVLHGFSYIEGGEERGHGITSKARHISETVSDLEVLERERQSAQTAKQRFTGISSENFGGFRSQKRGCARLGRSPDEISRSLIEKTEVQAPKAAIQKAQIGNVYTVNAIQSPDNPSSGHPHKQSAEQAPVFSHQSAIQTGQPPSYTNYPSHPNQRFYSNQPSYSNQPAYQPITYTNPAMVYSSPPNYFNPSQQPNFFNPPSYSQQTAYTDQRPIYPNQPAQYPQQGGYPINSKIEPFVLKGSESQIRSNMYSQAPSLTQIRADPRLQNQPTPQEHSRARSNRDLEAKFLDADALKESLASGKYRSQSNIYMVSD